MVGNDVVDLLDPDSDPTTLSPRFDERVFAADERVELARADDPRSLRWQLWAAKEAVYKIARRHDAGAIFSPIRFHVSLEGARTGDAPRRGRVRHPGGEDLVEVYSDQESVHVVSARPSHTGARTVHGILRLQEIDADLRLPDGPSRAVRHQAGLEVAREMGIEPERIDIHREQRMPVVHCDGRPADVALSLSHHGALIAWVFRIGESHAERKLAS